MSAKRLSREVLEGLNPGVGRPRRPQATNPPGIVHFGLAGFHRAGQAMVLDDLMAQALKDLVG